MLGYMAFLLSPGMKVTGDVTGLFGLGTVWREPGIRRLALISFIESGLGRRPDDLAADAAQARRDLGLHRRLGARRRGGRRRAATG